MNISADLTDERIAEIMEFQDLPDEDAPELTREQILRMKPAHPEFWKPKKVQLTIKLDADVLSAIKATGKGYQTRINNALRHLVAVGEF